MSNIFENKGAMTATVVVAAADSLNQAAANYVCDGNNDEVEIQAALDALPAGGGEVVLLDGTYHVETQIDLDSYQTLRGQGWNTILVTATANLVFLSAVGGAGTEKVGICIADMQIDGGAGLVSSFGIYWEYVDYSFIHNVYSRRHIAGMAYAGLELNYCDFNRITNNAFHANGVGIYLLNSIGNIIADNTFTEGGDEGIYCADSNENVISSNTFQGNGLYGIFLEGSNNNAILGNLLTENSQLSTNTYDDIYLYSSDYNQIQGNTCRAGGLANVPRYGINISNAGCTGNIVIDNDLYDDGFGTAPFNDAGTGTKLNTFVAPIAYGSLFGSAYGGGFRIVAAGQYAWTALRLPDKVHQVVRMKIYAMSEVAEADHMRLELVIFGAADNEAHNTHDGSIANHPSTSVNFAAQDVIFWTVTTAGVLALLGGDSVVVRALHEVAGNGDCATEASFRTVEIEYV